MRYALLVYQDRELMGGLDDGQRCAITQEVIAHRERFRDDGQVVAAAPLLPAATGLTVRIRNGAAAIVHGVSGNDELAAVWLIEARDLNEAVRHAARMPEACLGRVDVRPIADEEQER